VRKKTSVAHFFLPRCGRLFFFFSVMGKKPTQISGFFLYVSASRYRNDSSSLSFREYAPIADEKYSKLSDDEKEKWKQRARDMRGQDVGRTFRMVDRLLKKQPACGAGGETSTQIQNARENCVKEIVKRCWDLAL
jgi:hypothetical protein